jgi:thiosulfate/3-mercaptopyruvate sulfurtransferase
MNDDIVTSKWLTKQLNNSQVAIIDCRFQLNDPDWGERQYLAGHIPGACYLNLDRDLSSLAGQHGGRHPLPDVNRLAEKFAAVGIIRNQTMVVAYDDFRFAFASRLWWLLRYLGHDRVALLDGGWQQWQQQGYPITQELPTTSRGNFIPQLQTDWIVDVETVRVRKDLDSTILIDSRESDRYAGIREPIDPIAGSIPGAVNSPWKEVSDDRGYFKDLARQQQLWSPYASADEIIVYCGSGVTACVNLLSLKLAGFSNTKLYPGGWSDWCSYL